MKSRVFIGSSSESKNTAELVRKYLELEFECQVWKDEGFFALNVDTYHNLIREAAAFDYAVFVGGPDDFVKRKSTGAKKTAVRDNVYLEMGLYAGILSASRSFFMIHKSCTIASDLHGITVRRYENDTEVEKGCQAIKDKMREEEKINRISLLPSTSLAVGYYENYLKPVCEGLMDQKKLSIDGRKYSLKNYDKKFCVVIPTDVSADWESKAKVYYRNLGASNTSIDGKVRKYGVRIDFKEFKENHCVKIVDIPLTMRAAFRAVDLVTGKDYEGDTPLLVKSKEKEQRNFVRTLKNLIAKDACAAEITEIVML